MDNLDRQVGQRIRELRTKVGLSQEKLGEAADLHFSYIGQIERGEKGPSLKSVLHIARALGVPVSSLLEPDEKPSDDIESLVQRFRVLALNHPLQDVEFCFELFKRTLEYCRILRHDKEKM